MLIAWKVSARNCGDRSRECASVIAKWISFRTHQPRLSEWRQITKRRREGEPVEGAEPWATLLPVFLFFTATLSGASYSANVSSFCSPVSSKLYIYCPDARRKKKAPGWNINIFSFSFTLHLNSSQRPQCAIKVTNKLPVVQRG